MILNIVSYPIFVVSVIVAMVLSVSLFPVDWLVYRPEWLGLIVFYWTFRAPHRFGILVAWCLGLMLDVLQSSVLGINAFAMALIAFLVLTNHQRLRMFPLPQQCLMVFLLLGINQMLVHFVNQMLGPDSPGFTYLWPAVTSALAWPFICAIMDRLNLKLA